MWAGSLFHRDKSLLPTAVKKLFFPSSKVDDFAPRDLPLGNEIRLVWKLRIYWGDAYSPCAVKDMLLKLLLGHSIGSDSFSRLLFCYHIKRDLHISDSPKLSIWPLLLNCLQSCPCCQQVSISPCGNTSQDILQILLQVASIHRNFCSDSSRVPYYPFPFRIASEHPLLP